LDLVSQYNLKRSLRLSLRFVPVYSCGSDVVFSISSPAKPEDHAVDVLSGSASILQSNRHCCRVQPDSIRQLVRRVIGMHRRLDSKGLNSICGRKLLERQQKSVKFKVPEVIFFLTRIEKTRHRDQFRTQNLGLESSATF
jgi:hypothetical protein